MSAVPNYIRLEHVPLVRHPDVDERWLMARISEDPEILGLGDLILNGARTRSSPGRLELTLYKPDANRHYHIDIQVGATDEKQIRPRFVRVARLVSQAIPLVVLQMAAVQTGDAICVLFTRLVDVMVG